MFTVPSPCAKEAHMEGKLKFEGLQLLNAAAGGEAVVVKVVARRWLWRDSDRGGMVVDVVVRQWL